MSFLYKYKIKILLILGIIILCSFVIYFSEKKDSYVYKLKNVPKIEKGIEYRVVNVLDGDTFEIKIANKITKVRMLGIDTPETLDPRKPVQCFGKEASEKTKSLLTGKSVTLVSDKSQSYADKYLRILAYVYEDEMFINQYLVENGYAREYTYDKSYKFQSDFKNLEKTAKGNRIGLWSKC